MDQHCRIGLQARFWIKVGLDSVVVVAWLVVVGVVVVDKELVGSSVDTVLSVHLTCPTGH